MASVTAMSVRIAPLSTAGTSRGTPGRRARISPHTRTGKIARPRRPPTVRAVDDGGFGAGVATAGTDQANALDDHVPIDRFYTGLRQLHASPAVFIVDDFITPNQCDSIVAAAKTRAMDQSPVVYAGWTNDVSRGGQHRREGTGAVDRGALHARRRIVQRRRARSFDQRSRRVRVDSRSRRGWRGNVRQVQRVPAPGHAHQHELRAGRRERRRARLHQMPPRRSCPGASANQFEAPTVIRYQPGQKLAPHFDANRGADVEDANRGGRPSRRCCCTSTTSRPTAGRHGSGG